MTNQPDNQNANDDEIKKFIDALIDAKGLNLIVGEERDKIAAELTDTYVDYLNLYIMNSLPSDKQAELRAALEAEEPKEKLDAIVDGSGIDSNDVVGKATAEFAKLYLQEEE